MSAITVQTVLNWLDSFAPFDSAEEFDNAGLLLGEGEAPVETVVFGLDATPALAREALRLHAQLIVTHHPLIFHPLRRIRYSDPAGQALAELVRNRVALVAAHTNWDKAEGGVGDALAETLGLRETRRLDAYLRMGELPAPTEPAAFARFVEEKLGLKPVLYGHGPKEIRRVAAAGGAYGEGAVLAAQSGAQAYVVGEIHHHELVDADARGLWVLEAGHHATEAPGVAALYHRFLREAAAAGWAARAHLIDSAPYGGASF